MGRSVPKVLGKNRLGRIKKSVKAGGAGGIEPAVLQRVVEMAEQYRRSTVRPKRQRWTPDPRKYLSAEEFWRLWRHVRGRGDADRRRGFTHSRAIVTEAVIYALTVTGLRAAELCDLRWEDMPVAHGKPQVWVRRGKKAKKGLPVAVSSAAVEYLAGHAEGMAGGVPWWQKYKASDYFFRNEYGEPLSYQGLLSRVRTAGRKAGVMKAWSGRAGTRLTPHKLRHTMGMLLLEAGADVTIVKDQLRHRDIETTQLYAKSRCDSQPTRRAVEAFQKLLFGADTGGL